jgi:hypothetical protein
MSRINRARIVDGDQATAASLNDRFDDFSQANALNRFNLRDAAVDLPQLAKSPDFQAPFIQVDDIGKTDLLHASPVSVSGFSSAPYTSPHIVEDGAGNATFATYSGGLTVDPEEVLRIYWSLSVDADLSGGPATAGFQNIIVTDSTGGGGAASTSAGCFVAWLQWDITSSALSAWTEVPGQGDFKTAFGSNYGNALTNCKATTVIPLWASYPPTLSDGQPTSARTTNSMGWRGVSGAWHYVPTSSTTIYGLRIVLVGVMHPNRISTAGANNLVMDTGVGTRSTLNYTGGQLVTFVNRVK